MTEKRAESRSGTGVEKRLKGKICCRKTSVGCCCLLFLWLMAASSLEFLELQCGLLYMKKGLPSLSLPLFFLNLLLVLFVHLLLRLLSGRWTVSFYFSALIFFLWGQANFYTICFHGSPLFFSELENVRAALALLSGYSLHFHWISGLILLVFLAEMTMNIHIGRKYFSGRSSRTLLREAAVFATSLACLLIFTAGFRFLHLFHSDYILGWKWYDSVSDYGFFYCCVEDCYNTLFPFKSDDPFRDNPLQALEEDLEKKLGNVSETSPESDLENASGDNSENVPETSPESGLENAPETNSETVAGKDQDEGMKPILYPDIILILNESFYDISVCSDISGDRDYMEGFYSIEGARYGLVTCPNIGGRTNDSEYELLTGCSMDRLRASAPFNYLDLTQGPSLARLLHKLGYETTAMHCGQPSIYKRDRGYRDLGFTHVLLGKDQFHYRGSYGRREWLDQDNYRDLLDRYDQAGPGPHFFYLMTYQNHSGYDQNDQSLDTVHVTGLADPVQEEVDEYMTSVNLSVQAFRWLISRLAHRSRHRSRPLVVCMLGDHGPHFLSQLPIKGSDQSTDHNENEESNENVKNNENEENNEDNENDGKDELLRRVPYVVWTKGDFNLQGIGEGIRPDDEINRGIENKIVKEPMDMTDFMPAVLRGIILSTQLETSP